MSSANVPLQYRSSAYVPLGILQIQSNSESQCMASQVIVPKSAAAHCRML